MDSKERAGLAGQLIVGGFAGHSTPDDFRGLIERGRVGGAILFARNVEGLEQVSELNRELSSIPAPKPLWLAVDQEGGRVQRLRDPFPELPPMRALAESGPRAAALAAQILGRALKAMGFHQDYAPVVDVDTNPDNPVIGDRAFAADAARVAELTSAFIETLQGEGVAACAKHFPGHGDTHQDSHFELPRLEHDMARLESVELVPFRAAAKAGVSTIMTAHVLFPALDPDHPATLSSSLIEPVLRERFGFEGVVVSDDLEMKAVTDHYGAGDAAVRAIQSGCDQLLVCHELERQVESFEALVKASESGALSDARLREAAARVAKLKQDFVGRSAPPPDVLAAMPGAELAELTSMLPA